MAEDAVPAPASAATASLLTVLKRIPTVTPRNLTMDEHDDLLTLTCTVGYNNFGAVFWTLYDRDLRDIGHVEETTTLMDDGHTVAKVSVLRIGGWQVLPTASGLYPFKCNTFADFKVDSDTALVHSRLTDACGPTLPGKCEARGGRCVNGRCACVDERHPLRLDSVHTVCWPESKLGARCYFQEQCATRNSECVVNMGWCACRNGFARTLDGFECEDKPLGGLRARCGRNADCAAVNARCTYSHCECGPGTILASRDANACLNVTVVPLPSERSAQAGGDPWRAAPIVALQQQEELAPEAPSFGKPHKHIRDAPITDE